MARTRFSHPWESRRKYHIPTVSYARPMKARQERMRPKTVRLSDELISMSEALVKTEGWKDFSEFVRAAVRSFIESKKEASR